MNINATLEILHQMVWDFRSNNSDKFATPDVRTSANFAACEAAETLDAWIRLNTTEFNRAAIRDRKIEEEAMQCAMMILTALGKEFKYDNEKALDSVVEGKRLWDQLDLIEDLVDEASGVRFLDRPELGPVAYDIGKDYALAALSTVMALVEDPVEVMQRVLHTIYKKRVAPEVH
jgi:hypothetical protein